MVLEVETVVGVVVVGVLVVEGTETVTGLEVVPPLPLCLMAFLIARSNRPLTTVNVSRGLEQKKVARTICLRGVPDHDTTERGVLAARREGDVSECGSVDVARAGSSARARSADIDLDVRVRRDGLRPGVPEAEVPVIGVVEVGQTAVIVVELDVDGVEADSVQDTVKGSDCVPDR